MIEVIETYWLYFLIGQYPHGPLGGLALTVLLAAAAILLAMPVGVLLGLARVSPFPIVRMPVTFAAYLFRGLPLLMVIFWVYFFLPAVTGRKTGQFATMLAALVVFDGIYLAEIVRAGVLGMGRGQYEAARALGLGYFRTMTDVILPQALRHTLPSLVNQFVATIKATSLGYIIGLNEVSFITTQINTLVFTHAAEVYTVLGLTYFSLCFGLSRLAYRLERRITQREARGLARLLP